MCCLVVCLSGGISAQLRETTHFCPYARCRAEELVASGGQIKECNQLNTPRLTLPHVCCQRLKKL